jgi:hypothetical protein
MSSSRPHNRNNTKSSIKRRPNTVNKIDHDQSDSSGSDSFKEYRFKEHCFGVQRD